MMMMIPLESEHTTYNALEWSSLSKVCLSCFILFLAKIVTQWDDLAAYGVKFT